MKTSFIFHQCDISILKWGKGTSYICQFFSLSQWFSTGVQRNPWVPWEALGMPPIYEFDIYLSANCSKGCCQLFHIQGRVPRIKKVEKHWFKPLGGISTIDILLIDP